jgi:hypothetical protein
MKKTFLSAVSALALLASVGVASAQTTTTTTWTNEHGTVIREHSTTQKFKAFEDPSFKVQVGTVLPSTITVAPLPPTIVVPQRETYSYSIINKTPVIVDRDRKVVHVW